MAYEFIHEGGDESGALKQHKDAIMQWGLEGKLKINKFRIQGGVRAGDCADIVKEFLSCQSVLGILGISGEPNCPIELESSQLKTTVRSMAFFDKLLNPDNGVVGPTGNIGGCVEETFDGVPTGDLLRDALINPDSSTYVFTEDDKKEFIYSIFKVLAVGGSLCQPDHSIQRYLDVTKSLYKELLVIYRASDNGEIREASVVFDVNRVSGLDLRFGHPQFGKLFIVVNHIEKTIHSVQMEYQSYW